MEKVNYPSEEILSTSKLKKKSYDHIILWMLTNNDSCEWSHFEQKPIEIPISTISRHLTKLIDQGLIEKFARGQYKITSKGKKRFHELSHESRRERKLSYPPEIILKRGRNYHHWIIWMLYNNGFCKRSDFLEQPFSINQSTLSKILSSLIQKGFIIKQNKRYKITQLGKSEYSRILLNYDLDRQTILEEERKRIDEISSKAAQFFDEFNVNDDQVKYRFLNNVLKLDYPKVSAILKDDMDFYKILLFISINHPNFYPDYLSLDDFSRFYDIERRTLDYWVNEIIKSDLYDLKYFKINTSPNKNYYFHSDEKLEKILRAITEEHIATNKYLEKFGRSANLDSIIEDILEELCQTIFNRDFREALRDFLLEYIKYLAYKIEIKKEFIEPYDKLEGLIWHDMTETIQSQDSEILESQFDKAINNIDKDIDLSPKNYKLYNSKLRILLYFNQYDDVLMVLKKMEQIFPEKEIDIMIKKAYTLKRDKRLEEGLEAIEDLIKKYPKEDLLHSYKAYWLSYLGKKEEALKILQKLTKNAPKKGIYHDTYGEILMTFKEYDKAIDEFEKALEINTNNWFIYQTYIKIGICYTALEKFELAIQNLRKGKELTGKIISDLESKRKWLAIAELFIAEVKEQEE